MLALICLTFAHGCDGSAVLRTPSPALNLSWPTNALQECDSLHETFVPQNSRNVFMTTIWLPRSARYPRVMMQSEHSSRICSGAKILPDHTLHYLAVAIPILQRHSAKLFFGTTWVSQIARIPTRFVSPRSSECACRTCSKRKE